MKINIDKYAIVTIGCSVENRTLGTGFCFIKPAWIVTAKHVVVQNGEPRRDIYVSHLNGPIVSARVVACHPLHDLAVLELKDAGICQRPLLPAHPSFSAYSEAFVAGYMPSEANQNGTTVVISPAVKIALELRERDEIEETFVFQVEGWEGGNSGGPTLTAGGGVFGVVIEGFERDGIRHCRATSVLPVLNDLRLPASWTPRRIG